QFRALTWRAANSGAESRESESRPPSAKACRAFFEPSGRPKSGAFGSGLPAGARQPLAHSRGAMAANAGALARSVTPGRAWQVAQPAEAKRALPRAGSPGGRPAGASLAFGGEVR